jgi:DNA-binding beta-propeller fold protein YncE
VYIADKSGRIQVLDAGTGRCVRWWSVPDCEKGKPTGLTIGPAPAWLAADRRDVLYVAHTHAHRVMVYELADGAAAGAGPKARARAEPDYFTATLGDEPPALLAQFGAFGHGPGEFIYPTDVAILTAADGRTVERLYVGEYGDHDRVSVFDATFAFQFSFGTYGSSADPGNIQFDRPQSVQVDRARQRVVVADSRNHRLGVFTLDGALTRWIGSPDTSGAEVGQLRYPWSVSLLADGTALVVEFGNNRLQRLDLDTGISLGVTGRAGREKGEFAQPWSAMPDGDDAFVVDAANHRVQRVSLSPLGGGGGPGRGGRQ